MLGFVLALLVMGIGVWVVVELQIALHHDAIRQATPWGSWDWKVAG